MQQLQGDSESGVERGSVEETAISARAGNGAPSGRRRCRKCGSEALADENRCRECKSFLPGNTSALVHGDRRRTLANPEETELYQSYAADLGGIDQVTTGQHAVLCRIVDAERVCRTASTFLESTREGLASEKVQKALAVLATHANIVYRGASLLGLERRARQVDPLQALHDAVERANA